MAAVAVHMPVGIGNAPVAHCDRNLVECFGQKSPEIPVVAGASHMGTRVSFYDVIEVGKFQWVAQEKDGRIITD